MLQKAIPQFSICTLILATATACFAGTSLAQNDPQATWLDASQPPAITQVGNLPQTKVSTELSERSGFTNQNCIQKEIQTSTTPIRKLNGCWYATALGMLEHDGHYLLRPGEVTAMRLSGTTSSASTLHPTQNPNVFIEAHPNQATGYGFFATFRTTETAQTTPLVTPAGTILTYNHGGVWLKNSNNTLKHVEQKYIWQSENAKWMVIMDDGGNFIRVNLSTLAISAVKLRAKPSGRWIPGSASITNDGRYIAAAIHGSSSYSELYITDMLDCARNEEQTDVITYINCPTRTLKAVLTSKINNYRGITLPKFISSHTLSIYHDNGNSSYTQYLIQAPNTSPAQNTYLAFGDSYTSGEGAYDYLPTTDIQDKNMCHLSRKSYPYLLNAQFSLESFNSVACSGARIHHVLDKPQTHQTVANPAPLFTPGYKPQIQYLKDMDNKPTIITVSVGGNDIDFADKLRYCITWPTDCFNSYEDRLEIMQEIDRQKPRLQTMLQKIKATSPPNVKIYIIGYPSIVSDTSDDCSINMPLSKKERQLANHVTSHLNHTINEAAKAESVAYIHIEDALRGSRLCEAPPASIAMHGITHGNDSGIGKLKFLAKESLHPNAIGQQKIKEAILGQIPDFLHESTITPRVTTSAAEAITADAPKVNRPIYKRTQGQVATLNADDRNLVVQADGFEHSLKPDATYTISFNEQEHVTAIQTNERGDITTTLKIPDTITEEIFALNVQGADDTQELLHIYQYIHLPTISQTDTPLEYTDHTTSTTSSLLTLPQSPPLFPPYSNPYSFRALLNTTSTPTFLLNSSHTTASLGEQPVSPPPSQSKVLHMTTRNKSTPNSSQQLLPAQQKYLAAAYSVALLLLTTYVFRKIYRKLRKN